ncbi:hypothetical protein V8F06_008056 [Rhypophila decipiens]
MPHHVRDRDGDHHRHHSHNSHHRRHSHSPQPRRTPEFRFAIEMGLLVRSRVLDHTTILSLQKELSSRLTLAGVRNHHIAGGDSSSSSSNHEDFKNWTISSSLAISSKPKEHKFGLRLISPFMQFSWFDIWKAQLRTVLSVLNTDFETTITHQCSTHIHLVPTKGYWRLSHAISLAQSAVYHESVIDRLVPLYRRKTIWAKSNRWNKYLGKYPMSDALDKIASQTTFEGLAARMNWCGRDSPTGNSLRKQSDFQHEGFRWNFLAAGATQGYGAIEFRQMGGITESEDLISWITMVVLFAQVSVTKGEEIVRPSKAPSLDRLAEAVYGQAERSKVPKGRVGLVREGIFGMADLPNSTEGEAAGPDPKVITIDEDQRLRWVDKEGGGVGNTVARAKYWSLLEDLSPPEDGQIFVEKHW